MLEILAVSGYRSLRELILPLARLNVVTGANGSGKSSLYRALRLLADTARGGLVGSLAREGGIRSTLWAGPEQIGRAARAGRHPVQGVVRKGPVQLRLGFGASDLSYAVDLGFPPPGLSTSAFLLDPAIKRECVWTGPLFRPSALLVDRHGPGLRAMDDSGAWRVIPTPIADFESMMTEFSDPRAAPEMISVRRKLQSWRFYDCLRTDVEAPCRRPQVGTHTPILADDGADIAAALQTILEIGDAEGLARAVDDAFPGAAIEIETRDGWFELAMRQHGLLRPLKAAELSDGTLRYLMLIAALLTPRPPELLALDEPEASLHPDLIPALARLIAAAAQKSQIVVVTHCRELADLLVSEPESRAIELTKDFGETRLAGEAFRPRWEWPKR